MEWNNILQESREKNPFDAPAWIHAKCVRFNDYLRDHGLSGAVLSLSGGIDSAVTLALLKYTADLPDSSLQKIVALSQPIHSSPWALERARELCETTGIPLTVIDQSENHRRISQAFEVATGNGGNAFSKGQLRSYLRTPVNYFAAQLLREEGFPAIVIGTGNKDEDGYLAYFCKYGDGAVDVQLIADLHKSHVFLVGKELNVPESILKAAPSADLWDGQTDEDEMGFSYDFIEFFIGHYLKMTANEQCEFLESLSPESREEFIRSRDLCTGIHNRNAHKLKGVINL